MAAGRISVSNPIDINAQITDAAIGSEMILFLVGLCEMDGAWRRAGRHVLIRF